jgi:hypothetical protein
VNDNVEAELDGEVELLAKENGLTIFVGIVCDLAEMASGSCAISAARTSRSGLCIFELGK